MHIPLMNGSQKLRKPVLSYDPRPMVLKNHRTGFAGD
jgi:hypothetical protein